MNQGLHKRKNTVLKFRHIWHNILELGEVLGKSIHFSFCTEKSGNMFTSSTSNRNLSLLLNANDKQGKHLT